MAYPPAMQSEPDEPTWVLAAPNTVVTVPDLDAEARGGGPPSRRHRGKPRRLYEVLKRIFDVSVVVASSPLPSTQVHNPALYISYVPAQGRAR